MPIMRGIVQIGKGRRPAVDELRDKLIKDAEESLKGHTYILQPWYSEDVIDFALSLPVLKERMEKAEKWDAYQTELAKEQAHTERFISLMDAEEDELKRDAALWRKVKEIAEYNGKNFCTKCSMHPQCISLGGAVCYCAVQIVKALEASDEPK